MEAIKHLSKTELEAGLDHIRQAPKDQGTLELVVRRPQTDEREILEEGEPFFWFFRAWLQMQCIHC